MKSLNLQAKQIGAITKNSAEFESVLMKHFLNILQQQPKPQNMSKSIYFTCTAISILEQMGNKFPSQVEIDMVELNIKRYSLRKSTKPIFMQACRTASGISAVSKAA